MKVYVTTMYRWGDKECHSYVIYAGESYNKAMFLGNEERNTRGNKYFPEVIEIEDGTKITIVTHFPMVQEYE